jgi:hypothetical protein
MRIEPEFHAGKWRDQSEALPERLSLNRLVQGRKTILCLFTLMVLLPIGCSTTKPRAAERLPQVEITSVVQRDVPIFEEWVAQTQRSR